MAVVTGYPASAAEGERVVTTRLAAHAATPATATRDAR